MSTSTSTRDSCSTLPMWHSQSRTAIESPLPSLTESRGRQVGMLRRWAITIPCSPFCSSPHQPGHAEGVWASHCWGCTEGGGESVLVWKETLILFSIFASSVKLILNDIPGSPSKDTRACAKKPQRPKESPQCWFDSGLPRLKTFPQGAGLATCARVPISTYALCWEVSRVQLWLKFCSLQGSTFF